MFKKYLLPGCLITALTACGGGQDLDYGPANTSLPDDPPPVPEFEPFFTFSDASELASWTVESNKTSPTATPTEIFWESSQLALGIDPNWGGEGVKDNGNGGWDNITVFGTFAEPVNIEFGTVYLSLYYPREHLGNPWGTDPYWGSSSHHLGTQFLVIDSNGNRALLDRGLGTRSSWINSFDLRNSAWQRTDGEARGAEEVIDTEEGYWFDLAIVVGDENGLEADTHYFPDEDNVGDVDFTSIVSAGVVMNYALEFPDRNTTDDVGDPTAETPFNYWNDNPIAGYLVPGEDPSDPANGFGPGASERYIFLDNIALVPGVQPPPPPVEPPPALEESPEFGLAIYRDSLESGFNDAWGGSGASADLASAYGAKSGTAAMEVVFDGAGAQYQFGAPDETLDLTAYTTLDVSVWVDFENEQDSMKLWFSLCDCDDGIEVTVSKESWNNISIPVADFGKDMLFGALGIKNNSAAGGTIYIDEFGFDRVPDLAQPSFSLPVYFENAPEAGFSVWDGWGGSYDFASAARFHTGATAIELAYEGGYGSAQIGSGSVDIGSQLYVHLSAYLAAGSGSDTTTLMVQLCGNGVGCGDNDGVPVTVVEGEWTRYSLPISDFTGLQESLETNGNFVLSEIRLKNYTDSGKTVYVDNIGFDAFLPAEFAVAAYRENGVEGEFSQWDGWGGTYDYANTEKARTGLTSLKASYSGGYGSSQFGVGSVDLSGLSTLHVSAYLADDSADATTTVLVQLCGGGTGCGDNDGVQITVNRGVWTDFEIDISDFTEMTGTVLDNEIRLKNYTDSDKTIYYDDVGFDKAPGAQAAAFDIPVYLESIATGFSQWDGWGGTYNMSYTDSSHHGYTSGEFVYSGGYGAMQFGISGVDFTGMSTFHISAVMIGSDDNADDESTTVLVQLCGGGTGCGDNDGVQITVAEGAWQSFVLNVADFPAFDAAAMTEIRIKNYTDSDKTILVDTIGLNE